jgi:hypothetical protein
LGGLWFEVSQGLGSSRDPVSTIAGYSGAHLSPQLHEKLEDHHPSQPGQKSEHYLKITRAKRSGFVDQVVEHHSSKHKALSSNPRTTKNKTKKNPKPSESVKKLL